MIEFDSIEEAIEDIRIGKMVIVIDDENRENEGDFIMAADRITPEAINFMATIGRGLICTPITKSRAQELELPLMVAQNDSVHHTAFTVSIDAANGGTGISCQDRALTTNLLTNRNFFETKYNNLLNKTEDCSQYIWNELILNITLQNLNKSRIL